MVDDGPMVDGSPCVEAAMGESGRRVLVHSRCAGLVRRFVGLGVALCLVGLPAAANAAEPEAAQLQVQTVEPRAFGYRVGDVVERRVIVDIPARLTLDEDSLPRTGPQGPVLELRALERSESRTATGRRLALTLRYQVFAAPVAVRSYELPKLQLRFTGEPRGEDLRVETWPLVVAALAAEEASPREGLGELRPDIDPPLRSVSVERAVLWACAVVTVLLGAYLALVYVGLPWWGKRQRPFTRAYHTVKSRGDVHWRDAWVALHAAFNQTAGRTLFAESIDDFVEGAPRFRGLKDDIRRFYTQSQAVFFVDSAAVPAPELRDWLVGFARACRDAERGSA